MGWHAKQHFDCRFEPQIEYTVSARAPKRLHGTQNSYQPSTSPSTEFLPLDCPARRPRPSSPSAAERAVLSDRMRSGEHAGRVH